MQNFEWIEPTTIQHALAACAEHGDEAKFIAGGTWLSLVTKQGLLVPTALISLSKIEGLNSIRYEDGIGLHIGAMVSLRAAEMDMTIKEKYPELAATFGEVANVRIRNQATVGGCLCDADYASDPPATLAALNARVVLQSASGQREVPVREFIVGHYETTIRADEMLTEVIVPERPASAKGAYLKYKSRSSEDRPCVGVAAVLDVQDGVCQSLDIVVGAVSNTPQFVNDVMTHAKGKTLDKALIKQVADGYADSIDPLSDIRGTSWYRQQMIRVFVTRALTQLGGVA